MKTSREAVILVIESDDAYKEYICTKLEYAGYHRLLCAQSVEEVVEFLESEQIPDIVLLGEVCDSDILETAKKIKSLVSDIVLILLAKSPSITTPLEALSYGCEAWIEKGNDKSADEVIGKIVHWSQYKLESYKLDCLCSDRRLADG